MQVIIFNCTDPFHRRDVTAISSKNGHETCVDGEMFDCSCFLIFFRDPVMKKRESLEERVNFEECKRSAVAREPLTSLCRPRNLLLRTQAWNRLNANHREETTIEFGSTVPW
jgi:hypothetical protein